MHEELKERAKAWIRSKYRNSMAVPEADKIIQDLLAVLEVVEQENATLKTDYHREYETVEERINEVVALRTEITALKARLSGRTYYHDNAAVEAELERYRSALEEISAWLPQSNNYKIVMARGIARNALKEVPE